MSVETILLLVADPLVPIIAISFGEIKGLFRRRKFPGSFIVGYGGGTDINLIFPGYHLMAKIFLNYRKPELKGYLVQTLGLV